MLAYVMVNQKPEKGGDFHIPENYILFPSICPLSPLAALTQGNELPITS